MKVRTYIVVAALTAGPVLSACSSSSGGAGAGGADAASTSSDGGGSMAAEASDGAPGMAPSPASDSGGAQEGGADATATDAGAVSAVQCGAVGTPHMVGAGCNTLRNGAPSVMVTVSGATPATPAGGAIASGTYFLTSAAIYDPGLMCSNDPGLQGRETACIQETILVDSSTGTLQSVSTAGGPLGTDIAQSNGSFVTDGTGSNGCVAFDPTCLAYQASCGSASFDFFNGMGWFYTATANTITLFTPQALLCDAANTYVQVYTKQ